ncbi:hypothetical protein D3Z37_19850, partial [Lachnospiraceae bacterium]|nr:hypothetical protein [Lachnospiraceae bacterium]
MARMERWATAEAPLMGLRVENCATDCFHGAATRSAETAGEKREACVAMAIRNLIDLFFCFLFGMTM